MCAAYLAKDQTLSIITQTLKKALAVGSNSSQYQLLKTHYQSSLAFKMEQSFFDSLKRWEIGSLNGLIDHILDDLYHLRLALLIPMILPFSA
ncbi:hypothetical protein PRO82_000929 [Candidatus Protochlamydia amoebophila]|uniref:hypothetical protein n=1 Tax=Candidatus Protochlamydia amoebophila TaxID=362787 RepID=UPI001BC9DE07|nr:hypothetical protein [Candidatus Protochlamydia amoebophila]MBS4163626.1 hypothetical protein [Candidatus Protochlamydia amoebophila]